jgi:serine/threonine-protein kinase
VAISLPGGDLLAAAVAAGETPSPRMVAAAGGRGAVPVWNAVMGVVAVMACFVAVAKINDRTAIFRLIDQPLSMEVLADRARQHLEELEIPGLDVRSWGMFTTAGPLQMIEASSQAPDRWDRLRPLSSSVLRFWYREGAGAMTPVRSIGIITPDDPWPGYLGSTYLELDGAGRMRLLSWVPEDPELDRESAGEYDWSILMARAGLESTQLHPVDDIRPIVLQYSPGAAPVWPPVPPAAVHRAWIGTYPDRDLPRMRVDALAWRGLPLFFRVDEQWSAAEDSAAGTTPLQNARRLFASFDRVSIQVFVQLAVFVAMVLVALIAARYNLRQGRGDPRSAWRFGLAVFVLELASTLLVRDSFRALLNYYEIPTVLGWPLFWGTLAGVAYLAVEPVFRRYWPDSLISWTRLFSGKFGDPMVGRDMLAGAVAGSAAAALVLLGLLLPSLLGLPGQLNTFVGMNLVGVRHIMRAAFLDATGTLPVLPMVVVVLPLILLRRRGIALVVTWLVVVAAYPLEHDGMLHYGFSGAGLLRLVTVGLAMGLILAAWVRFGFLALLVAYFFAARVSTFPITLDLDAWYGVYSRNVWLILSAIALGAAWVAVRRGKQPVRS